jgi:hypothetical protein
MGVELPASGSGIFQRTFSVALHFSGTLRSVQTPRPSAPRHPGQLAEAKDNGASAMDVTKTLKRRIRMRTLKNLQAPISKLQILQIDGLNEFKGLNGLYE